MVKYDDAARVALHALQSDLSSTREEIIIHTQFRRNTATSPSHPEWGKPNPIDINGIIARAFAEGIRYANGAAATNAG